MQVEQEKRGVKQDELMSKEKIEREKIESQEIIEKMRIDAGFIGNFFAGTNDDNRNNIDDDVEIEKQDMMNEQKQKELDSKEDEADKQRKFDASEAEKDRKSAEKIASKRKQVAKT